MKNLLVMHWCWSYFNENAQAWTLRWRDPHTAYVITIRSWIRRETEESWKWIVLGWPLESLKGQIKFPKAVALNDRANRTAGVWSHALGKDSSPASTSMNQCISRFFYPHRNIPSEEKTNRERNKERWKINK